MEYAQTVVPMMRELREILLPHWGTAEAHDKEGLRRSIVTDLDIAAEIYAAKRLSQLHPGIPFVGEERGGDRSEKRFWLMDPIDGTVQFVKGEEGCTSMLALIEDGAVVFSVIYDFPKDLMYWAEKGRGAFCEDLRLAVSTKDDLEGASVLWEMNLEKEGTQEFLKELSSVASPIKSNLAGWELLQIATGVIDGRVAFKPFGYDYDFAAGSLIVSEAGGVVRNFATNSYNYRDLDFVAGNESICRELVALQKGVAKT
jgi:myo-inositol-1(or 4)-monophosphatase